jgi:starvation-inducible DNA-binding protein
MSKEIGIKEENSQKVANELAIILADENLLYIKTKDAHWNVEGNDFLEKHKFFESQMEELDAIIDRVAERIRSIGHYAPAGLKIYLELTTLSEESRELNNSHGFIKDLLSSHGSIIMYLRGKIKLFNEEYSDMGSSDFITGLMEEHEKMAWFLRSHLK